MTKLTTPQRNTTIEWLTIRLSPKLPREYYEKKSDEELIELEKKMWGE